MKEKQAVTREYKPRSQKATKKTKSALLDKFTRLTGCHRKSAVRLLHARPVKPVMVYAGEKAVQLKPKIKRPPNRKGKRVYTDEVIAGWPAFTITPGIAEKLSTISPATIDRYLKKDKDALRLKGKSLAKPLHSLKSRIPIRTFYAGGGRKKPGFRQIDTGGLQSDTIAARPPSASMSIP